MLELYSQYWKHKMENMHTYQLHHSAKFFVIVGLKNDERIKQTIMQPWENSSKFPWLGFSTLGNQHTSSCY